MAVKSDNTKEGAHSSSVFPRQDIPETQKDPKTKKGLQWCEENVDYGVDVFKRQRNRNHLRLKRNYDSYNGVVNKRRTNYLTNTYGKKNIGNFVDYRLGRTKVDLLEGEWINSPLNAVVEVINRDAKSKKLDLIKVQNGMMAAGDMITKLRELIGVDVFDGMEIPEENSEVNTKTVNEKIMQIAIDYQIKKRGLKGELGLAFKDILISSECFGKIEMAKDGTVCYRKIHPKDAIYIESENDPFMERGPIWGHRERMFVHDIFSRFNLSKTQRDKINQMAGSPAEFLVDEHTNYKYYERINNELSIDVFFVEWKSVEPVRTKVSPDKKNPNAGPFRKDLSHEFYEKNKKKIERDVEKGKYKIETTWKEVIWEGVRIGHDMYIECKKQKFQIQRRKDGTAKYKAEPSYVGMLYNTVDGLRVSFMELMENISFLYNVVMYQMAREISKLKGKIIAYDEAFLPRKKTIKDVMHGLLNDGIYIYNSSQDGNKFKKNVTVNGQIQEIDLGISRSFQQLTQVKFELEQTLDNLTGVNRNRQGQIAASSTVTNAISSINASKSITTPIFFWFDRYEEKVITKVAEKTKLAWVYLDTDEANRVIGDAATGFYNVTRDLANDDYTAFVGDGQKDKELREKIELAATASLNSKELAIDTYGEFLMADTAGEAIEILRNGWKTVKEIQQQEIKLRNEAQQQQTQTVVESQREAREDQQAHEIEKIMVEKNLESEMKTQEAQNELILNEGDEQQLAE